MKIQILMVDDHQVVRDALKYILNQANDMEVAAEAGCVSDALELLKQRNFDVVLLDLSLPGRSGMDLLRTITAIRSAPAVLVVTAYTEDQYAAQVFKDGGHGYINKERASEQLVAAVRQVVSGRKYFSREIVERLTVVQNPISSTWELRISLA